jgi:hypothetical protein
MFMLHSYIVINDELNLKYKKQNNYCLNLKAKGNLVRYLIKYLKKYFIVT